MFLTAATTVTVKDGAILDKAGNAVGVNPAHTVKDVTKPIINRFFLHKILTGKLTLNFSEPVNGELTNAEFTVVDSFGQEFTVLVGTDKLVNANSLELTLPSVLAAPAKVPTGHLTVTFLQLLKTLLVTI